MNGTGPFRPGGGGPAPHDPTNRGALVKAIDEEESNLRRLDAELAEAEARLGSLRADLVERDPRGESPAKPQAVQQDDCD